MSAWRSLASSSIAIAFAFAAIPAAAQTSGTETLATEWLGPRPSGAPVISARGPIWQGSGAMMNEQQEARRLIRGWFPASIADGKAAAMIDGFSSYLAAHAVEREFDRRYLRSAHSVDTRAYLGGHVVWSFPALRLSREAALRGDPYATVFTALERWIGLPSLQAAMFEVAHLSADKLGSETIVRTISDAAGQDLEWLFDAAESGVGYAVTALNETSVTVTRIGSGVFTGRSAPRVGDFESGDALRLLVKFADGTESSVRWDGRDESRKFAFVGPSRAIGAYIDPDRIVALDRNRLDNAIFAPAPTNVPVRKWTARWMVWLQHTMLSYGFLA